MWNESMVAFLSAARSVIRSMGSGVAVAMTLTQRSVGPWSMHPLLKMPAFGPIDGLSPFIRE